MAEFVRGSPCGAVQFYQWDGAASEMDVGVTQRTAKMGNGYNTTFGGFAECGDFLQVPVGTIRTMCAETYREGEEELDKETLQRLIPPPLLMRYAQPLEGYLVRHPDPNNPIHAPVYYAFPVTREERRKLSDLPPNDERAGQIEWLKLRWEKGMDLLNLDGKVTLWDGEKQLDWKAFYHQHEVECVFFRLAFLADSGRLWNDRSGR